MIWVLHLENKHDEIMHPKIALDFSVPMTQNQ